MRTYEHIFIVHPEVVGDDYAAILDKFKNILTEQGANILKVDEWGARKLAYPVKKQTRGTYVLMTFEAGAKVIAEFERRLRLDEKIIKFQTIVLPNGVEIAAEEPAEEAPATEGPAAEETA
ncbi:30S ribosomal protein S6 [Syntrophotalea acetylenivorans]|uniref:Small ribosomal subunit protein bS6 n=1 Tax=Syntrophotalea acetylenivorans TaxID=1842532 RepID=A0A1L3GKS7_9BACT|nr:30S ribosomal protein S6 [Syntrophotalea acetylenivorans]APG26511.1 30S ribosomal protein S6 [Syntrophotalea acetylenivorans]